MMKNFLLVCLGAAAAVLTSCKSEDEAVPQVPDNKLQKVFVVNRGQDGKSTLSVIMRDNSVVDNVLPEENSATVHSVEVIQGKIWVVYDNPGRVSVLNLTTYATEAEIAHLTERTRFQYALLADDNLVAVSDAELRSVFYVDTRSNKITQEVALGRPVGRMVDNGTTSTKQTRLFVAGGEKVYTFELSGAENTVREIDVPASVGSKPVCDGSIVWFLSPGALTGLAREGGAVVRQYSLDDSGIDATGGFLSIDAQKERLYFNARKDGRNAVFSYSIESLTGKSSGSGTTEIEPEPLPDPTPAYYCDGVESLTYAALSLQQTMYVCDARDGLSSGRIYEYDQNGNVLNTFEVGVCPSELFFLR